MNLLRRRFVVGTGVALALYQVSILVNFSLSREEQSHHVLTTVDGGGKTAQEIRGGEQKHHRDSAVAVDTTSTTTSNGDAMRKSPIKAAKKIVESHKKKNDNSKENFPHDRPLQQEQDGRGHDESAVPVPTSINDNKDKDAPVVNNNNNSQAKKDRDNNQLANKKDTTMNAAAAFKTAITPSPPPPAKQPTRNNHQKKYDATAAAASSTASTASTPSPSSSPSPPHQSPQTRTHDGTNNDIKALSYSLWGSTPRYTQGMIHVAQTVPEMYADWQVWIYHDNTVPQRVLKVLGAMAHVRLLNVQTTTITTILPQEENNNNTTITTTDTDDVFEPWVHSDLNPMTWRFLIASDSRVQVYAIRDSDALPSHREYAAVQEFLASQKLFHILRDHPQHDPFNFAPILGGMWGGLHRAVPQMKDLLYQQYHYVNNRTANVKKDKHPYGNDQDFLRTHILPLAINHCLQHDSYFCRESHAIAFPLAREDSELDMRREFMFVGNQMASRAKDARQRQGGGVMAQLKWKQRYQQCLQDRKKLHDQWLKQQYDKDPTDDNNAVSFARYINTTFTGKL